MPGKKAAGRKTAQSVKAIATIAHPDFVHGLVRRLFRGHAGVNVAFDILDDHDRIVDHDADGKDDAEQG